MILPRRGFLAALLAPLLLSFPGRASAQQALPPRKASPLTVRQIHSGHSLTDTYMSAPWPGRLALATSARTGQDTDRTIGKSTIPGSPLHWRWSNATPYPDARKDIRDFELLVITEGGPLSTDEQIFSDYSLTYMDRWVEHAWKNGNGGSGAEVMLYSFWVGLDGSADEGIDPAYTSLPFRQRLDVQGALWERLQDHANANRPSNMPPIYMIPGHMLIKRIHDDIGSGAAPGLTSIDQIYGDNIHLNAIGQYAVTCLVYAVIYQRNPRELPDRLAPEDRLSSAQARYFKTIAWETAIGYNRAGVSGV